MPTSGDCRVASRVDTPINQTSHHSSPGLMYNPSPRRLQSLPPVLGAQSVANLDTTSADLEVVLSDNGNDATTITFYYGTTDGGPPQASWDSNLTFSNASEATIRKSVNRADQRADLLLPHLGQKQLQPKQRGGLGQFLHRLHHRDQFDPRRDRSGALLRPGRLVETGRQPQSILQETTGTAPLQSFKHPASGLMRRIPAQTAYN